MNLASHQTLPFGLILAAGLVAPFLVPSYSNEIAVLWLMIVFASTWDILGGQMGYNSLGNKLVAETGANNPTLAMAASATGSQERVR